MQHYLDLAAGPLALAHQERRGSREIYRTDDGEEPAQELGPAEVAFLTGVDSFFLASNGEQGWPYVQHRGGPTGFVHIAGPRRLAWAERPGNRQFLTAGNLGADDRVSLIAVDQPRRLRLKLLGHGRFDPDPDPKLLEDLGVDGRMEALMIVDVVSFAWNCPKYITPRFTEVEIAEATQPLRRRIAELEATLAAVT